MDNNNFFNSLTKSLLSDVRKVMEAKAHTIPKTDKEKKLAALAEPTDKITHADVLKGRGVTKEEAEPVDEMSSKMKMKLGLYGKKKMKEDVEQVDEALDAAARYAQHHTAIKDLLKSIDQHVKAHKEDAVKYVQTYNGGKKGIHWGHVGDLADVHSQLANIHDRLAQQGEYKATMGESTEDGDSVKFTAREMAFLETQGLNLDEAKRGRPAKNAPAGADEEPAALGYQLRKATSVNRPVHFMNGEKKEVSRAHIEKFNDHMAAHKTTLDKAAFQKRAHKSHAEFVKAVSEPLPNLKVGQSEIVKYK